MRLVFLYGPPASGKLTVARELAAATGLPLFHNHLVVDTVASVFPFGSEPFVRLREQFWLAMFGEAAADSRSIIFTFAPEPSVSPTFPQRVRELVIDAGGAVLFVRLTVPPDEQERRIGGLDRASHGKLRSPALLRQLGPDFAACDAAMPAPALTLDTGSLTPAEAAQAIVAVLDGR